MDRIYIYIILKILEGQEKSKDGLLPEDMKEDDITQFKYAPITSVEIEINLSAFKTFIRQSPIFII